MFHLGQQDRVARALIFLTPQVLATRLIALGRPARENDFAASRASKNFAARVRAPSKASVERRLNS